MQYCFLYNQVSVCYNCLHLHVHAKNAFLLWNVLICMCVCVGGGGIMKLYDAFYRSTILVYLPCCKHIGIFYLLQIYMLDDITVLGKCIFRK